MVRRDKILSRLEPSVIRVESIEDGARSKFGTAFLIERNPAVTYWLTCAHVITDLGGTKNIQVQDRYGYKNIELAGLDENTLHNVAEHHDLAVFQVEGLFSHRPVLDLAILDLDDSSNDNFDFISLGNFKRSDGQLGMRPISGQLYLDSKIGYSDPVRIYKLKTDESSPLQSGYSGSPIFVPKVDKVVGVINQKHREKPTDGYGVSIEALANILEKVPDLSELRNKILNPAVRITNSSIQVTNSLLVTLLDWPLRRFIDRQTRTALEWFAKKRIKNLAKEASNYAMMHSEILNAEITTITDPKIREELFDDFQWELEKYLERIYNCLLTDSDDLLVHNEITPSLAAEAYETALDYIKNIFPDYFEERIIRKISKYMNCLIENLY